MITDYDCWHPDHDHVTVEAVIKVLIENAAKARSLIKAVAPRLRGRGQSCFAGCHTVLDTAIITPAESQDPTVVDRLDAVAGRVLKRH
jgi:5'-methylthioadenosine phosphorylase